MTSNEWVNKQRTKWNQIATGAALEIASIETHRQMGNRIFVEGEAVDGPIGAYNSTKPIYVNPKDSPRKFTPQGKTGKRVHKNGEPYKTKYFTSYREFRSAVGRAVDKVNLNLRGLLQSDFITGLRREGSNTFISVLKRQEDVKKARGAEKHFGKKIFSLSKDERKLFVDVMNRETQRILNAQ